MIRELEDSECIVMTGDEMKSQVQEAQDQCDHFESTTSMLRQQLEESEPVNAQLAKQKRLLEIESAWAEDSAPAVHGTSIELESIHNLNVRLQTEKQALQVQLPEECAKFAASQEQINEFVSQNWDLHDQIFRLNLRLKSFDGHQSEVEHLTVVVNALANDEAKFTERVPQERESASGNRPLCGENRITCRLHLRARSPAGGRGAGNEGGRAESAEVGRGVRPSSQRD
jgi:chromosome segregation ATPase